MGVAVAPHNLDSTDRLVLSRFILVLQENIPQSVALLHVSCVQLESFLQVVLPPAVSA